MTDFIHIFGLLGMFAVGLTLVALGRLSQRLGQVTRVPAFFIGHYAAALLIWGGMLARLYFITRIEQTTEALNQELLYTLLNDGFPAAGITLGLLVTWYYWSWLLAERD